jgi:hypothetical protein
MKVHTTPSARSAQDFTLTPERIEYERMWLHTFYHGYDPARVKYAPRRDVYVNRMTELTRVLANYVTLTGYVLTLGDDLDTWDAPCDHD